MARTRVSKHGLSRVNHGYITGKSRVVENPGFDRNCPKPRFWVQIPVISRVNYGYNTGESWVWGWSNPHPRFTCKIVKKICSQSIKRYHFRWNLPKKTRKKKCFIQHPCLSNQMSGALMSNSFGSLHIRQKLGKSRVLAKTGFSRVKPGFTFHCPSKPRFIHKPEKFPGFGGIGYIYIYNSIYKI